MRLLLLLVLPSAALADVGEVSLRPYGELRRGPVVMDRASVDGTFTGGGLVLGYGWAFPFTATLRYGFDALGHGVRVGTARDGADWEQRRHLVMAGLAWAPSDELTPALLLEGGASLRQSEEHVTEAGTARDANLYFVARPAARFTAGLEWRFTDFFAINGGAFAEHAEGFGYGATFSLSAYRYLF